MAERHEKGEERRRERGNMNIVEALEKALAAFGPNGENWAQGDKALTQPYCCVTLALSRIRTQDYEQVAKAQDVLWATMGLKTRLQAEKWNDTPERTWPEVKAAYEKAIFLAQQGYPMSSERRHLKYFKAHCEVWVKPLSRKARPKVIERVFVAHSLGEFYDLVREHYRGNRFKFIGWEEVTSDGKRIYP